MFSNTGSSNERYTRMTFADLLAFLRAHDLVGFAPSLASRDILSVDAPTTYLRNYTSTDLPDPTRSGQDAGSIGQTTHVPSGGASGPPGFAFLDTLRERFVVESAHGS